MKMVLDLNCPSSSRAWNLQISEVCSRITSRDGTEHHGRQSDRGPTVFFCLFKCLMEMEQETIHPNSTRAARSRMLVARLQVILLAGMVKHGRPLTMESVWA